MLMSLEVMTILRTILSQHPFDFRPGQFGNNMAPLMKVATLSCSKALEGEGEDV